MTIWYDPQKSVEANFDPVWPGQRFLAPVYERQRRGFANPGDAAAYAVRIRGISGQHKIRPEHLSLIARLGDRIGMGLVIDQWNSELQWRRRNPLINENIMFNRADIKARYRSAVVELRRQKANWESVRRIKAQVLDRRLVQGMVKFASTWPEVLHIAYDGEAYEAWDGRHVAPEGCILLCFWPVLFRGEGEGNAEHGTTTRGMSGVVHFSIDAGGRVNYEDYTPYEARHTGHGVHPHLFTSSELCPGTARLNESQLLSLSELRKWWVGTDDAPASGMNWSVYAKQWYEGTTFREYYGGARRMLSGPYYDYEAAEIYRNPVTGRWDHVMRPVTDDGLDIPGLSLPEYNVATLSYIEAPVTSPGYEHDDDDNEAESKTIRVSVAEFTALLEDFSPPMEHRFNHHCDICDTDLAEDDYYTCYDCDRTLCADHEYYVEAVDEHYCQRCYEQTWPTCATCEVTIRRNECYRCRECNNPLCEDCVHLDDRYAYCEDHLPSEDDDEDEDDDEVVNVTVEAARRANEPLVLRTQPVAAGWMRGGGGQFCQHEDHRGARPHAAWMAYPGTETGGVHPAFRVFREADHVGNMYACEAHVPMGNPPHGIAPELTAAEARRCAEHGNIDCHLCDSEGFYREDFVSDTGGFVPGTGGFLCEIPTPRVNNNPVGRGRTGLYYCAETAAWRRRTRVTDQPHWVCDAHYRAMRAARPETVLNFVDEVEAGLAEAYNTEDMPNFAEMESDEFWPIHEVNLGIRWIDNRYRDLGRPYLDIQPWSGAMGIQTNVESFMAWVMEWQRDPYSPMACEGFECEWPNHEAYMQRRQDVCCEPAAYVHHDCSFLPEGGWRYTVDESEPKHMPHLICEAHHTAIVESGLPTEELNPIAQALLTALEEHTNG